MGASGRAPGHTAVMTDIVDRIMALWLRPPPGDDAAADAFRELYTGPVLSGLT